MEYLIIKGKKSFSFKIQNSFKSYASFSRKSWFKDFQVQSYSMELKCSKNDANKLLFDNAIIRYMTQIKTWAKTYGLVVIRTSLAWIFSNFDVLFLPLKDSLRWYKSNDTYFIGLKCKYQRSILTPGGYTIFELIRVIMTPTIFELIRVIMTPTIELYKFFTTAFFL